MAEPLFTGAAHGPWGVPDSHADLRGPTDGVVSLPIQLCWSGNCSFDLADPTRRLMLYQTLLLEGDRSDIEEYLDAGHLMTVWPRLRRMLHSRYIRPWEERFPELAEAAKVAEPALQEELRRAIQAVRESVA
jgi:hypothetical protein